MAVLRPGLLVVLAAALAGCSGTPFGDQLSRSFSTPATPGSTTPASKPAVPSSPSPASPQAGPAPGADATKPRPRPEAPTPPAAPAAPPTPAPYRVTIKLPAADPSSPAEAVTDALRQAGVAFEVEMIERVPAGGDAPVAPVRSPAPPAR